MDPLQQFTEFCSNFKGSHPEIDHLNVVLLGSPGSGKSSFVNMVLAATSGKRIRTDAVVGISQNDSIPYTRKVRRYNFISI